jgi:3-phosphoshikimate 1-carboxyvinyltransferase
MNMASGRHSIEPSFSSSKTSHEKTISFEPSISKNDIEWQLPPSKSHLIRTLLIASQSDDITVINGIRNSGLDVNSMKNCLMQLGVKIEYCDEYGQVMQSSTNNLETNSLKITGVGSFGFKKPHESLNVGNSGTTLRLIALLCARFDFSITIDGDESIRRRNTDALWNSLLSSGVDVSIKSDEYNLPVELKGPWFADINTKTVNLDVSKSSQPFSAWMLSSPGLPHKIELNLDGEPVSNRHWMLSKEICKTAGANIELDNNVAIMAPWNVKLETNLRIPKDASMASFAMLAASCLGVKVNLIGWPNEIDCLGHEVLQQRSSELGIDWIDDVLEKSKSGRSIEVDLTDCNDIITPLSIIMALGYGGNIIGASHSSFKESNRLLSTSKLLKSFGLISKINEDGLEIQGGQKLSTPDSVVETFGDHRVFMSAILLASKVGGEIDGFGLHNIADELFIERLIESKITLQ